MLAVVMPCRKCVTSGPCRIRRRRWVRCVWPEGASIGGWDVLVEYDLGEAFVRAFGRLLLGAEVAERKHRAQM